MVKRLLADTFFLHLHRKSSSYSSCSTTQMIASPGQAANPTEMTLLPATRHRSRMPAHGHVCWPRSSSGEEGAEEWQATPQTSMATYLTV